MAKKRICSAMLAIVCAAAMTGCGNAANGSAALEKEAQDSSSQTSAAEEDHTKKSDKGSSENQAETGTVSEKSDPAEADSLFTERDLAQTADTADAENIKVSDGKSIDITEEGVYVIGGTAKDCTIRVNADEKAKVQLVLDGVSITNTDFPAIYAVSADKVFLTTTDSENSLTVSGQFRTDGDTKTDAAVFSKNDLVLNGTGTLKVTADEGNGISCKDDLKITGGTYQIHCSKDAFEANDLIAVNDGTFSIETDKDGFHCENDKTEGTITVLGGTFDIQSGSDGMQACALLEISGGTVNITSAEGLEATYVRINDGTINIDASDDGINAVMRTNTLETAVEINGGKLTIAVGPGDTDAIDSNGSIYVNGGTIDITAQMSSFDYDRTAEFNGGTIIINGEEVSEIPQSMMGGGMHGQMPPDGKHGQMPPGGMAGDPEGGMFDGRHGGMKEAPDGTEGDWMQGRKHGDGREKPADDPAEFPRNESSL